MGCHNTPSIIGAWHFITSLLLAGIITSATPLSTKAQPDALGADCGCLWQGSFSEVAPEADLVVLGQVQRIKGNAVDLLPERVLNGALWLDTAEVGRIGRHASNASFLQIRDRRRPGRRPPFGFALEWIEPQTGVGRPGTQVPVHVTRVKDHNLAGL